MFFLSIFFSIFYLSTAHTSGWQEVGNGGEGLYCFTDSTTNYLALDYFETQNRYRMKPQLSGMGDQDEVQVARSLISRLQGFPNITSLALDLASHFYTEATMIAEDEMPRTQDGGKYANIPELCAVIQIALQRPPSKGENYFYTLNQDAWKWMSPSQRGIIIAHEVLYRIAIGFGEPKTSESLRYLMTLLIADEFKYLSKNEAALTLNHARLWLAVDTPHLTAY